MIHEGQEERPAGSSEPGGLKEDLRVQRSEEELRAGVREREAGAVGVKKTVRTESEEVRVPKMREEVEVERVPIGDETQEIPDGAFSEEEIVVRVYEEEVVVSKRVVLKEEIRIRKRVVEEMEVVEVDLRKEEVEIDDRTRRGAGREPANPQSSTRAEE